MTTYTKATLKTFFETLDVPSGSDFANLIDSYVNIVDTTEQSMAGPLKPTELITAKVSATTVNVTGTLTSKVISCTTASFTSTDVTTGAHFSCDVSADDKTVYASALRSTVGLFGGIAIVSATGTTAATGAVLTAYINRGQGTTDGSATGFLLQTAKPGLVQYLVHEGAVSGNLWPTSDCKINALASGAAFSLAANTMYTIIHKTASAYAVK